MADSKSQSRLVQVANMIIPFIAGGVFATLFQQLIQQGAIRWASFYLMLICFCLAAISGIIYLLFRDTNQLVKSVGMKVSYLERERGSANLYRRAKDIIEKAEKSILILNSPVDLGSKGIENNEDADRERKLYYESLLDQVKRGKGKVKYERLLQIKEGQELKNLAVGNEYRIHLHRMLDKKKETPDSIHLGRVKARRLATFVLVDGKHLILESNELDDAGNMHMHGYFIIEDPHEEITTHFMRFFESARYDDLTPVKLDQLPPLNSSSLRGAESGSQMSIEGQPVKPIS